jgi:hypothetical protein
MYADDPRWQQSNGKFVAALLAAADGLSETEKQLFLQAWYGKIGADASSQMRGQQGTQARGV